MQVQDSTLAKYIKSLYKLPDDTTGFSEQQVHRPWQMQILRALTDINKTNEKSM